mgnify:CR=1 FL=1
MSKVRQTVQDNDFDQENGGLADDQELTEVEKSTYSP